MRTSLFALCVIGLCPALVHAQAGDPKPAAAAELRSQLQSTDPEARQAAALALARLDVAEEAVIRELAAGMGRRKLGVYLNGPEPARLCQEALARLGAPAVPALIQALEDEDFAGRDLALEALGKIGPAASAALPAVRHCLTTDNIPRRCLAAEVQWRIDGDADSALQLVTPLLSHKRGRQCDAAVRTLVNMGAAARPAMPALIAALHEFQSGNVLWAIGQLAPHDRDRALPVLREALQQPQLADEAAEILQSLEEPSDKLLRTQLTRLQNCRPGDGNQPQRIIYTIVIHGQAATSCFGDLVVLLRHANPEVRRAAAWGLPRVFADNQLVISILTVALLDPDVAEEARKSLDMLAELQQASMAVK